MVSTWGHLFYFVGWFLVLPLLLFLIFDWLSKRDRFRKYQKYVIPFLSLFTFLFLLKTFTFVAMERKLIVYSIVASILFALVLHKHWKKIMVIQFLMACMAGFSLLRVVNEKLNYSDQWKQQPDGIEQVVFQAHPNVYLIEPDGYIGFEALAEDPYAFDNGPFEEFLRDQQFKNYPHFRTNYVNTLASNVALFTMKHHWYGFNLREENVYNANKAVVSDNAVLNAFKRNGYETYLISETQYFFLNKPLLGYHHSNIDYSNIAYLHNGMGERQPVLEPFFTYLNDGIQKPKFFFIQLLHPWHVSTYKSSSLGKELERKKYLERLEESNKLMKKMIAKILEKDPNGLIVIMADHGGYVGFDTTQDTYKRVENPKLLRSIFSAVLSIHWPRDIAPHYDSKIKTPVNFFRILFSFMSDNSAYLDYLQTDESFMIQKEEEDMGIYKYCNSQGEWIFEKVSNPDRD
ncbi:MAG: sulfatase-like hydrolase/transferase [Flavobacteriaceae bacterium]